MELGLGNGGEDGEHNGDSFVGISRIVAKLDAFLFGTEPFWRSLVLNHLLDGRGDILLFKMVYGMIVGVKTFRVHPSFDTTDIVCNLR